MMTGRKKTNYENRFFLSSWRGVAGNVSGIPGRLLTRASSLVTSGLGQVHQPEDKQPDLPKLPVPELDKTIQRYLEAIEPILSTPQFQKVQELSKTFLDNEGPILQHELVERQLKTKNWAYDWWLNDMYMNNPLCLPINSNPGGVWPTQKFPTIDHQLQFASKLTTFMLDFKDKLDRNEIPVEKAASREPGQPLCMAQHYRLMSTYRVPCLPRDYQRDTSTTLVDHIVVAYKKHFFSCPIRTVNRRLTTGEIFNQFKEIVQLESCTSEEPVGILTSQSRPTWADARVKLLADDTNKQSVEEIESCYFIICLDDPLPSQYFNSKLRQRSENCLRVAGSDRDETSMLHQMLHGGGSIFNTSNRWFDKTLQFIVSSDGVVGLCYEHSAAEAIGILNMVDEFVQKIKGEEGTGDSVINGDENPNDPEISKPLRLEWILTPETKAAMTESCVSIDELIQDLDLMVFRYEGYGKDFIKKCRVSPDVYCQLALQLAHYSLHKKMVATYESASTRRFKLGRVDCIRSTTMEALEWLQSMGNSDLDNTDKKRKFHSAVDKQTNIMIENITGEGIDCHLLGLKQQAIEMGMELPEIFKDESFSIANYFALSTSQLPTKENQFMGYGPVVPNGYGASYNPRNDSIIFCVSSWHSSSITSTGKFCGSLQLALDNMKKLLEAD